MPDSELLVELSDVTKAYSGLRPLRIKNLELRAGEAVALLGVDAAMSEVLVNLITGAQLPDSGEVRVFGRPTTSITGVDDWVAELDRFGLISERAVLVDQFTALQNLALPLSLEIEPPPPALQAEVRQLARNSPRLQPRWVRRLSFVCASVARLPCDHESSWLSIPTRGSRVLSYQHSRRISRV